MNNYSILFRRDSVESLRFVQAENEPHIRRIARRMSEETGMTVISIRGVTSAPRMMESPSPRTADDSAVPSRVPYRYTPFVLSVARKRYGNRF